VPNLVWIVVEDANLKTELVTNFLSSLTELATRLSSDLKLVHLNMATPVEFKTRLTDPNWLKPRGVLQRNEGLEYIRMHYRNNKDVEANGVIYFADDDNTYDLKIFEEMRTTTRVSVWPVGLVGGLNVEKPLVEDGLVVGWNTQWQPKRQYPIDMAGFAMNLDLVLKRPQAKFTYKVARGHQESHIIGQLIRDKSDLEPKAANCTKVFVWHTRTENPKLNMELRLKVPSDHGMEL
jgi:galactosylgalactosylxylosylprotein 3-beta-glucuronosyltransferase 3